MADIPYTLVQIIDTLTTKLKTVEQRLTQLEEETTNPSNSVEVQLQGILERLHIEAALPDEPVTESAVADGPVEREPYMPEETVPDLPEGYQMVRQMSWLNSYFPLKDRPKIQQGIGKRLTTLSVQLNLPRLLPERTGNSHAYHPTVISKFREMVEANPQYMLKDRV